jgi:hypothetical protein
MLHALSGKECILLKCNKNEELMGQIKEKIIDIIPKCVLITILQ